MNLCFSFDTYVALFALSPFYDGKIGFHSENFLLQRSRRVVVYLVKIDTFTKVDTCTVHRGIFFCLSKSVNFPR